MTSVQQPQANRLIDWVIDSACTSPRAVVAFWLALAVASVPGIVALRFDSSTESVLDRTAPEWQTYRQSVRLFGNDEDIVVALSSQAPFDARVLAEVARLSSDLQQVSGVQRVDSITTSPSVGVGADGELRLVPLVDSDLLARDVGSERLSARILADESARGLLVSSDGRTFGIRLRIDEISGGGYGPLLSDVRRDVEGTGAWVSGVPVFREETGRRTRDEVVSFVPLTLLVIAAVLMAVFRSAIALGIALGVSGTGTVIVLGIMGGLGVPLTLSTAILPPVLLAIGCASTTHLLCEVGGGDARHAARGVARPILLSGAVTSLAFLSGTVVPIEAIRWVGAFGALGALVLAASAVSLGTALAVIYAVPERTSILAWLHGRGAELAVRLAGRHAGMVLLAWIVLLAACGWGVSRIRLDTDVTNWFPRGGEVRDSYEEIRARLAGISPINIMIEAPAGRSVAEPDVVSKLAAFTAFLEGLDDVDKAMSIANPIRKLHEVLTESSRATPLPSDAMLIHQYLLLLDSTEEASELIADDRMVANVTVRVSNNGSERLLELARVAREWWDSNGIEGFAASPTGIMFEFARAEHSIALGQLGGLALDLATLAVLYLLVFRSVILTLIALVPSVVTVVVAFGLLGFLGAPLDAGTVFVGMLAIGVTVDETIHLVSAFSQRLARRGDAVSALEQALQSVFPALCVTTIALAGGFAVLGLSSFAFTQRLGALTAVAMIVCAAASSSLLPALLGRYRGGARV